MISAARTHVGCRRTNNEDAFLAEPEHGLYVVCDGMGGHEMGEIASHVAVEAIRQHLDQTGVLASNEPAGKDEATALEAAIRAAHERVCAESEARELPVHMGTTVVAALVRGDRAVVANVGDSRAYIVGPAGHLRLTCDHTVARMYAQAGLIREEDVNSHPMRGVLMRCIGAPEGCDPDTAMVVLQPGERLLLCSDGLTEMIEEDEMAAIVRAGDDPASVAQKLVSSALAAGGRDNVTVVVVEPADPR